MEKNNLEKPKEERKNLIAKFKFFFNENEYLKNKIVFWLIVFSALVNITNWIMLRLFIQPVDLPMILHYNVYFGVDIFGNWKETFFSPIIGLILLLVNAVLGAHFYKNKERVASYLLLIGALMIQCGMLIYSISLIVINY
jgi:hypothetical protein